MNQPLSSLAGILLKQDWVTKYSTLNLTLKVFSSPTYSRAANHKTPRFLSAWTDSELPFTH